MKAYAQPLALCLVSIIGLVLALVLDGVVENLATTASALPLLVLALRLRRPPQA